MIEINFNQLLKNYDQDLLNDLRGFGKNNEYLKYWVPGTDNFKSFSNLVDALVEAKIFNFKIKFYIKSIDIEKIKNFFVNTSSFKEEGLINDDWLTFKVEINKSKYDTFKKKYIVSKNKIKEQGIDTTKSVSFFKSQEDMMEIYNKNINMVSSRNYESKESLDGKNIFKETIDDLCLKFQIENFKIEKIIHNGSSNPTLSKLVNIFCDIIIKKNIQEASEHGVIFLEEKIRLGNKNSLINGIILPHQAGRLFSELNSIIRSVEKKYYIKNNQSPEINKDYFKTSEKWKSLDLNEKKNK